MTPILRMWRYFDGVRKELYLASFLSAITMMSAVALMASLSLLCVPMEVVKQMK